MKNTVTMVMIGSGCMDEYYEMDFVPELGEKVCCDFLGEKVGGMIGNAAAVAASYGMNTYLMDTVNGNEKARQVLADFEKSGVNVNMVRYDPSLPDVKCLIFLKDGERIIYVIPTKKKNLVPDPEQERYLKEADYVYTTLGEMRCFLDPIGLVDMLRSCGVRLVLDVEYLDIPALEQEWELIKKADVLFVNSEGNRQLKNKVGPAYRQELNTDCIVVLTEGDQGCSIYKGLENYRIPAYRVTPVDTTGAGDTFNVSFLYGLSLEMSLKEAGEFANAAAARSILFIGPRSGAVGETAVRKFMNQWKGEDEV
ncbi:hypothetical protein B5E84_05215 [Lachnoclostridium sp. An14]|uniref:carbohydrate kinase family protein n=1 Tax=Lachnoclostridium sp. An14 TaxID=1965562 RepID=UPI000B37F069|nr:carbohydrate kinase family protein [Lachnoclostridium sp. An14]OUQ20136.1 hypothetical protein B5E84_05215 [Lachnoclostridium sp. An14]